MKKDGSKSGELSEVVVRICPACGIVNPSGSSQTCPHLQLARFDGLNNDLAELLGEVARARCNFDELLGKLKQEIKEALRKHEAEIETRKEAMKSAAEKPQRQPPQAPALSLENPKPLPANPPRAKGRARKAAQPPPIDPRQLELIAREPPKGEA
jgi:hypothetical protein